jgi:hypothetical protein
MLYKKHLEYNYTRIKLKKKRKKKEKKRKEKKSRLHKLCSRHWLPKSEQTKFRKENQTQLSKSHCLSKISNLIGIHISITHFPIKAKPISNERKREERQKSSSERQWPWADSGGGLRRIPIAAFGGVGGGGSASNKSDGVKKRRRKKVLSMGSLWVKDSVLSSPFYLVFFFFADVSNLYWRV